MRKRGVLFIILLAILLWAPMAQATHIRAGEITIERKNCQSLTFVFFVTGYVDLIGGQVLFGGGTLDFGDGQKSTFVQEITETVTTFTTPPLPIRPKRVIFNDYQTILTRD
jgi:hypothetical protein